MYILLKIEGGDIMTRKKAGKQSFIFSEPPIITHWASVVGKKEAEGPLGGCFDKIEQDSHFGQKTWEQAEKNIENNEEDEEKNYIRRERSYNSYKRSFNLGDLDQDNIKAEFDNGMLNITVPKKEITSNKKKIDII